MKKITGERTPEEWQKLARKKCLDILVRADKSEFLLRKKLREAGFSEEIIDDAVAYADHFHYIDDERYAESYVRSYRTRKSTKMMSYELAQNGVSEEIIQRVLSDGSEMEEEALEKMIARRLDGKDIEDDTLKQKTIRYLLGKGYSFSTVKVALETYLESRREI